MPIKMVAEAEILNANTAESFLMMTKKRFPDSGRDRIKKQLSSYLAGLQQISRLEEQKNHGALHAGRVTHPGINGIKPDQQR